MRRQIVLVLGAALALSVGLTTASAGSGPNPQSLRLIEAQTVRLSDDTALLVQMRSDAAERFDLAMAAAQTEMVMGILTSLGGAMNHVVADGQVLVGTVTKLGLDPGVLNIGPLSAALAQLQQRDAEFMAAKAAVVGSLDISEAQSLRNVMTSADSVVASLVSAIEAFLDQIHDIACDPIQCDSP